MDWSAYATFLAVATLVVLLPGPDFAVVTGNTLAGGRPRGMWCSAGVATANAVHGVAAVAGLGALIVGAQPVFSAITCIGALYLAYLGARLLWSAMRGQYPVQPMPPSGGARGWRQGFLTSITNPKLLVFYLAVLPQFLTPSQGVPALLLFALSHAALSLVYLLALVGLLHHARRLLARRWVRRTMDGLTGTALLAFGARLALDRA